MVRVEATLQLEGDLASLHLVVVEVRGHEEIGQAYVFEVLAELRDDPATRAGSLLEIDGALSTTATLELTLHGADGARVGARTLRAMVDRVDTVLAATRSASAPPAFTFVLRPRLFELSRFVTQDIFVGASIPGVIAEKLEVAGIPSSQVDVRLADETAYASKDAGDGDLEQGRLVVQYRESDLAFVSRLAEHVGISFFFDPDELEERLVLTDFDGGFAPRSAAQMADGGTAGITRVLRRVSNVKSEFFAYDYNYRTPHLSFHKDGAMLFDVLGGSAGLEVPSAGALLDYAPNVKSPAEAEFLARRRAEEEEAKREIFELSTTDPTFVAGQRFCITGHAELAEDAEFVAVAVTHRFEAEASFLSRGGKTRGTSKADAEPPYLGTVLAVRANKRAAGGRVMAYRPPRRTPKPRIDGVVTGIVQSALEGQALDRQHIDREGRYLVKLHFDQGPKTMPRLRMAQPSAGAGYGQHFPLRPGAEVLIAFLDGDPDRPVIVGALPNPTQRSPVTTARDHEPPEVNRIRTQSGVVFEIGDGLTSSSRT